MARVISVYEYRNDRSEKWFSVIGGVDLVVSEVDPTTSKRGWSIAFIGGGSFWVTAELCDEPPKLGEPVFVLPYRSLEFSGVNLLGVPLIGLEIGGRRYLYQTDEEYEAARARDAQEATDHLAKMKQGFIDSGTASQPLPEFQCSDQALWDEFRTKNSEDPYGFACVRYAARWAHLMEARIADGACDIASFAKETSHEADDDGITGFMYGAAVAMLTKCWIHGEALRRWHNLDVQIHDEGEKANASGGVLNPALLTTG